MGVGLHSWLSSYFTVHKTSLRQWISEDWRHLDCVTPCKLCYCGSVQGHSRVMNMPSHSKVLYEKRSWHQVQVARDLQTFRNVVMQAKIQLQVLLIPAIIRQLLNVIRQGFQLKMDWEQGGEWRETVDRYQAGGADVKALMFSPSVERVELRLAALCSVMALSCSKHQEMQLC